MEKSEDAITMYLIVRESLNMSIGKTAAQCAHASQMLHMQYDDLHKSLVSYRKRVKSLEEGLHPSKSDLSSHFPSPETYALVQPLEAIYEQWLTLGIRKVVLSADEKEWAKLLSEEKSKVVVKDAGLTELTPGTDTVIGLWPIRKSQTSKTIKKLQVLK